MSNRQSGSRNTLFNYFNKLPNQSNGNKQECNSNKEPLKTTRDEKRKTDVFNDEEEDNATPKRRRLLQQTDSSDDENIQPTKRRKRIIQQSDDSSEDDSDGSSDTNSKNKLTLFKVPKKSDTTPTKSHKTPSKKIAFFDKNQSKSPMTNKQTNLVETKNTENNNCVEDGQSWLHNRLDFLKPQYIRDKNKRRPDDSNYDARTLYVPPDFHTKQTPAMSQWWSIKSDHYDCVLFFKVGKFYELYHMDAVVGVNELGFSYMKGDFAHSGFPESAYGRMVSSLVELGYKVARVEQTETPEALSQRNQSTPKGLKQSKVVRREICQITNMGTRVQGLQDLEFKHAMSSYLLAICEHRNNNQFEFGVCFVDTSIGVFHLGQFHDDDKYSRLLTMLAQYPPVVILEERKQLSSDTKNTLRTSTGNVSFESLASESQFLSSEKTLKQLRKNEYFGKIDDTKFRFPAVLQCMINEEDPLNTTCKKDYDLAVKCLGACMWYLQDCLLDIQLLSMGKFELYIPPDMDIAKVTSTCKFMILDSNAKNTLHIFGEGRTLENTLDLCCTAMGKRLLHQWICKPLCNIEEIRERQDAISELIDKQSLLNEARTILKTLPDLERLISKIHCLGNRQRAQNHPDSRAIFYEEKIYSKKKVQDFMLTLSGFEKAMDFINMFSGFSCTLLKKYTNCNSNGLFPDILNTIISFKNSFNAEEAEKEGKIIPQRSVDIDYDIALLEIEQTQKELDEYLIEQNKFFGCSVQYFGTDKKRYQLDIPEHVSHKANTNYFLEGTKKGSKPSKRYTTNVTKNLLARMMSAETKLREILSDINRRIFEKFSNNYEDWSRACYCIAVLDVLCSMAQYTSNQSVTMCVPDVLPFTSEPIISINDGVHPFIPNIENFVPNDTHVGSENKPQTILLTGPNMGGKSTLMRQVALLTLMAQIGCHVPASSMKLSLVDRIFTRLGAHDDIITGSSTFLVELKEALAILQHATKHSLVCLDELGRGTATYDGTAIATSYLTRMMNTQCRLIFSTHYYSLMDFFKNNDSIQHCHMSCKVQKDENHPNKEIIIFLYKMMPGQCPKSYGFNAARLAGIPHSVIARGQLVAQKLEGETIARKLFRKFLCDKENVRKLLNTVSV